MDLHLFETPVFVALAFVLTALGVAVGVLQQADSIVARRHARRVALRSNFRQDLKACLSVGSELAAGSWPGTGADLSVRVHALEWLERSQAVRAALQLAPHMPRELVEEFVYRLNYAQAEVTFAREAAERDTSPGVYGRRADLNLTLRQVERAASVLVLVTDGPAALKDILPDRSIDVPDSTSTLPALLAPQHDAAAHRNSSVDARRAEEPREFDVVKKVVEGTREGSLDWRRTGDPDVYVSERATVRLVIDAPGHLVRLRFFDIAGRLAATTIEQKPVDAPQTEDYQFTDGLLALLHQTVVHGFSDTSQAIERFLAED